MRILFTADWHIKLGQKNIPTEWAINRYKALVEKINSVCAEKDVELHVIGGDIFDRVPSLEELALFFEVVRTLKTTTLLFDGNHEATKKGDTFLKLLAPTIKQLQPFGFYVQPSADTISSLADIPFDVIPYCDLKRFERGEITIKNKSNLLFTHVRGNIPPHVVSEVPLEIFQSWNLVLAGDLHSHSNSQENIVYPGSPLTTTFHRNEVECGGIVLDTSDLSWEFVSFGLPQLIRKTISDPTQAIPTDFNLTIYELEGNVSDLAKADDNPIIDKKISRRVAEASLILTPDMSIEDEISEYLRYILNLEDSKVLELLKLFHDSTKGRGME